MPPFSKFPHFEMRKIDLGIRGELLFYSAFIFISAFLIFSGIVLTFTKFQLEKIEEEHYAELLGVSMKGLERGIVSEIPYASVYLIDPEKGGDEKLRDECVNLKGINKKIKGEFLIYGVSFYEGGKKKCAFYTFKRGKYLSFIGSLALNFLLFTILFSAGFIIFAYSLLSRIVLKPILELFNAVKEISAGNEERRADESGPKEIRFLSSSFNKMIEELMTKKRELERTVKELEDVNREMRRAQEEMVQAERLASIGRLSAGVAHELGNPLSTITMLLELLKSHLDEKGIEYAKKIEEEVERMNRIIRNLLDLSRPFKAELKWFNPEEIIKKVLSIVLTDREKNYIKIDFVSGGINEVFSDPNLFSQILINLLLNAKDAVMEKGSGEIIVKTEKEGEFFVTEVKDTGTGMDKETLEKIFEPFFTTKPPDKGTGLGLSISRRLAGILQGKITVSSEKGKGSTFRLYLPLQISSSQG